MVKFAYIFLTLNMRGDTHRLTLSSPGFDCTSVGVGSLEEGAAVAKELASAGYGLLELCSGFGVEGAKMVLDATGNSVPVAFAVYTAGAEQKAVAAFMEEYQKQGLLPEPPQPGGR